MKFNYSGKTILITGASNGIGKALVYQLANYRCNLILIARRNEFLEIIENELKNLPASIYTFKGDVSNKNEIQLLINTIYTQHKKIDLVILNAGISSKDSIHSFSSLSAEEIMGVNYFGSVYPLEVIIPKMISQKSGVIAGVSSTADNRGYNGNGFYSSSKAALTIMLERLRIELHDFNIKVITIRPGFVPSGITKKNSFAMPFMISQEKAASKIISGISRMKKIIQFPIPTVFLSTLIGLIPSSLYSTLRRKIKM